MKPSTAKAKGTATETLLVEWMRQWVPHLERRRLQGAADRGDIAGIPGTVIEVKSGARLDLPGWLDELRTEMANDQAETGVVAVRPKGRPNPAHWFAVMPLPLWVELMIEATHITPPLTENTNTASTGTDSETNQ